MTGEPDPFLISFLAERDVPCPQCDYNLRDLQTPVCPECGEQLELRLALAEPNQAAWLTSLIGLSAGAGFDALLLLYILVMLLRGIHGPSGREFWIFVGITGGGLVLLGSLVLHLLRSRRRFRGLTPSMQWTTAAACWTLSSSTCWFSHSTFADAISL